MVNVVVVVVSLLAALAGAVILGARRWESRTRELRARLQAARMPVRPQTVDFRELEGLPAPVERFFRAALEEGQPMVAGVRVRHHGTFNMGETADRWKPFTSDQEIVARRPGFDWDGRIAMMPGLPVRVHDAYVAGEGLLHASLLGLFPLANVRGAGDMAEGELMRFLAEAAWYPTVLLPSQGVRWGPVDGRSAHATLTEGSISVTMLFAFNESGLIDTVRAEARGRMVGDEIVPTPWEGRFWNYRQRDGLRVPADGEVAWILPTGAKPYWRGRISEIVYEFTLPAEGAGHRTAPAGPSLPRFPASPSPSPIRRPARPSGPQVAGDERPCEGDDAHESEKRFRKVRQVPTDARDPPGCSSPTTPLPELASSLLGDSPSRDPATARPSGDRHDVS